MSNARPIVNLLGCKRAIDIPHIAFATGLAGWAVWYCWDAWHANASVENMIMILPVSAIALVLYFFVIAGSIKRVGQANEQIVSSREPHSRRTAIRIAGSMALLAAFVVAAPLVGFDVASFLYMLLMIVFLGERRILVLAIFPLLFTVVVIYCFGTLLATPLPVLILRGQN